MPSKKILIILIFSISIVISIWFIQKRSSERSASSQTITTDGTRRIIETGNDWQKILTNVDTANTGFVSVIEDTEDIANDPSLTAKVSKDFFSQYLLAIKDKGSLTQEDINQITTNILSSSEYTETKNPVYLATNLKILNANDKESIIVYKNLVNKFLKESSTQVKNDPLSITMKAIETENVNDLQKLDPIIGLAKNLIKNLLDMNVPSSAVPYHLKLINTFSAILSSLESMRESVADPIKGLSGITQYQNILNYQLNPAIQSINSFFIQKTGSAI
jgi:hypothetical protein